MYHYYKKQSPLARPCTRPAGVAAPRVRNLTATDSTAASEGHQTMQNANEAVAIISPASCH